MNSSFERQPVNTISELKGNETIKELAHRHAKDKNHTTTDDELRNAKIELSNVVSIDANNPYLIKSFRINI